ncbi:TonB-dependent receptor plug domain-containing protein, partial [Candidatus Margulisiibacteriota bacterium]
VPRLKSTVPWNTKLITREDIERSASIKLGDIIRSVPGVSVKANGGLSSQISARFRGANSQQVLVLLNGSRINSPSLGTFDLGDILLTDVERIEVVKAPLSALYGADAVGGVVNIITRRATPKPELNISAGYGEFSTRSIAVAESGPNYFLSASSLSSAGFRANSDYTAHDLNVRLFGRAGKIDLEAGVKRYTADKGSPGSLDFLTPQARQIDKNLFYDLGLRVDNLGFKASLAQIQLDQRYVNPSWAIVSEHKTITTNFDAQQAVTWFPAQTLVLGTEIRNDRSQSTNSGDKTQANKAVFVQDEIDLKLARLVIGGRADLSSAYGNHFNPRVGCVFGLPRDMLLRVSWGTSFKAPTINDLYWTRTTEPGWPSGVVTTEGNPALSPETAQSFELSLERTINAQSTARVSAFVNEIKDMIRWSNTSVSATDAYWTPLNVSNARIEGMEFEYERKILDRLDGFLNFSYQTAKDSNSNTFLDYAPQTQFNAGLAYTGWYGLASNFVVRHVGERYADLANTTKLPAYTVVDASLSRGFGKWTVKFDVENLFGESYAETYGFTDVYPMPGRRYNVGVSYKVR